MKIDVKPRATRENALKHPILLLNVPSTLEFLNQQGPAPARVWVQVNDKKNNVYHVEVFTSSARQLFNSHPFKGALYTYQDFVVGLLAHEYAHILAGALDITHPYENDIYAFISNVLDDSHDEYFMQRHYPVYASYINATLLGLKYTTPVIKGSGLEAHLNTLFQMVRFGHVPSGSDEDFRDFCLPVIKSSVRGGRKNALDATVAIYEYLRVTHEKKDARAWQSGMGTGHLRVVAIGKGELESLLQSGDQAMATDTLDALQNVQEGGKFPGVGEHEIVIEEKDDDFYRSTVLEYAETIAALRIAFLQKYDKPRRVKTFEGELEMSSASQQKAYVAELLGEDTDAYYINKKQLLDIKVITYRDVSSSTSGFKDEFAKAIIIFHAALDGLHGVKKAHVDFSNNAYVSFGFEDEIAQAQIYPKSGGNTNLMPAIDKVKEMDIGAKRTLHFVVTDGYISQPDECQLELATLGTAWFIEIIPPGHTSDGGYIAGFENSFATTLENLPFELMDRLG